MSEETDNQAEEIQEEFSDESPTEEQSRRRYFTRRNIGIFFGLAAILVVLLAGLIAILYRTGYTDNFIKRQFTQKMADFGIVFEADVFEVTILPLELTLKNATFVNKKNGEKLFRIGKAELGLTIEDLYEWQLSRDIKINTTDVEDFEAWVKFDENGNSNFQGINLAGPSVVNYSSVKASLKNGVIHFGDVTRTIAGDVENVRLEMEPVDYDVPDEEKRYKFDFSSSKSNIIYDGKKIEPIGINAEGIADGAGAEITLLKLTAPLGESNLRGKIRDWQSPKYDFDIDSTIDLTQTSDVLPLGTAIRGVGSFKGKVVGEGEEYKVEGEINSESLAAENIRLKALKVTATVAGKNSTYDANGKAVAELLTFEDFKIDYPQIIGNIRGTGTDFRWVGELQAAALKSPLGSLGGLYITDAFAEFEDSKLNANLGNVRARSFVSPDADVQNLQARNVKVTSADGTTNATIPNARASSVKIEGAELNGVDANGIKVTNRGDSTDATINGLRADNLRTNDGNLKNLKADGVTIKNQNDTTNVVARNFQADSLNAGDTNIQGINASNVDAKIVGNETIVYTNNVKVAKIDSDAAILGSLNVAGVRLTIRQGRIEGRSGDIDAGTVTLKDSAIDGGGRVENVKIFKPVFVVEPSGRYRATADMSIGGGVLGSVKLGNARASVVAEDSQVALNNLRADIMDGNINGNATIALNNSRRSVIKADFNNLDLSKLLALSGGKVVPIEGKTTGRADLSFPGTNVKVASGTIVADFVANAGTAERGLVPVNGNLTLNAKNGLFDIDNANLFTDKTQLNATGSFDLNGYDSNLNVALNSSDASEIERIIRALNVSPELEEQLDTYEADFAGNLTFNGNLRGKLDDPVLNGRASLDSLILRGRNLGVLATNVSVTPTGIELTDGKLQEPGGGGNLTFNVNAPTVGTNNISVQAELNNINTGNLLAALPVDILPEGLNDFQARTSGKINLSGLPNEMQGEADIVSGKGTINGEPFDGFQARATFQGNLVNLEKFEGQFGEGTLIANGTYQTDSQAFDFDVRGENVDLTRVRPFIPNSQNLPIFTGTVDLTAKATGEVDDSKTYNINFNGTGKNVVVDGRSVGDIGFVGKTENQQLNADITANFEGQPQIVNANVNFADPNLPFRAETNFNQTELAPLIALVQPEGIDISGSATGRVFIEGNLSQINANGDREFTTDNLQGAAQFSQFALQIQETPLVASEPISVKFNSKEVVIENARFEGGGSNIVVSGTKALTDTGINNLAVDGKINLRIFNAVSADTFFSGIADVSVRLTGSNETARLNGQAQLENASFATFIGSERINFNRIQGRIIFTSDQAQIDNLSAFLGGGRITASGGALIEGLELQRFRVDIRGNNFTAPLPPDFITTGNAEIEVSGFRQNNEMNTLIRGSILAKRSVYLKDIDLADIIGGRRSSSLSQGGTSGDSASFFGVPKLDLRIDGRDFLVVRNNIADLTASASLRVTGDVEFPQISGRVTANSGTVFFRKDRYEVQRAVIEFPPNADGIEPVINLQAETEIKGYQIIVGLSGNVAEPESLNATFRSNPALPQPDVVSLITTGNLADTSSGIPTYAQTGINTAAEILTDSLINDPASRATDKLFGLNRFELDPLVSGQRSGPTARLTVGRQINRNLLITYSTNLSEDQNQVIALEYRVSNRLSFVAQYEQTKISNVTRDPNVFRFEVRLRKRF